MSNFKIRPENRSFYAIAPFLITITQFSTVLNTGKVVYIDQYNWAYTKYGHTFSFFILHKLFERTLFHYIIKK
jgi:hypothetical protein